MKNAINILSELNIRLLHGVPEEIAKQAAAQNGWFSEKQIALAAEAIRKTMLQPEELKRWLAKYEPRQTKTQQSVLIIMAGNIPFVGFFDLICVLAAGDRALVKSSHKDRVLMEWIIDEIIDIEPSAPINIYREGDSVDRIIATGGDAAVSYFEKTYQGKPMLLRGSRHSVAIVTQQISTADLHALSNDIYTYSGLGCRNVSLLFIPKGYGAIEITHNDIEINPKYNNNYLQTKAIYELSGTEFTDNGASCFVKSDQFPSSISTISVIEYTSIEEVEQWLSDHDHELQCVVAESTTTNHPRRCDFGEAQYPTLYDYADGVDTMLFLNSL